MGLVDKSTIRLQGDMGRNLNEIKDGGHAFGCSSLLSYN